MTASNTKPVINSSRLRSNLQRSDLSLTVQVKSCQTFKNDLRNRCKACVAKKAEGCRFVGIRAFPSDRIPTTTTTTSKKSKNTKSKSKNVKQQVIDSDDAIYFVNFDGPDLISEYRDKEKAAAAAAAAAENKKTSSNGISKKSQQQQHRDIILHTVCKALSKMLQEESQRLAELDNSLIRRRAPIVNMRHVCDVCLTSIFNLHYMCSMCALDICVDCHDKDWSDKKNEKVAACSYKRAHTKEHMVPVIKYDPATLGRFKEQLISMDHGQRNVKTEACDRIDGEENDNNNSTNGCSTPVKAVTPLTTTTVEDDKDGYLISDADALTLDNFRACWKQGKPVMVKNVMDDASRVLWSPETFIEKHGDSKTEVIDCRTGYKDESTVERYFKAYNDPTLRSGYDTGNPEVLKIKDWPPKENFSEQFPDLYQDFMRILPIKEYCTVDGVFNLSNRLPKELLPPDLGPKMFIAFGSDQGEQGVGTTKLHCDMADAVNVMCHANNTNGDRNHSAAVWDIFPYESLMTVRAFVGKIANENQVKLRGDPIHDQWLYLNDSLLERLEKEHGVKGWRLHQNPGDAVFIPAGCAHQVSNYHSAIKCAYDFVSPENVVRCLDITSQFGRVRREDALQLKNTLLFAWSDLFN